MITTSWVQPRGLTADDAVWTRLGSIDGTVRPLVDGAGLVAPSPGRPAIDWWVGADDGWHVPAREAAVRQSLVRGTPVVETALRVPGGDAVHRATVVRLAVGDGGGDAVLVEVENRSGIPFALALALRPFDAAGPVDVGHVELRESTVYADGHPVIVLAKPPNRACAADAAAGDALEIVTGVAVEASTFEPLHDPAGQAQAVVIVPVAHTQTFRAIIPLSDAVDAFPSVLPSAADVAEGWRVHVRDAARATLPDTAREKAIDALPPALFLAAQAAEGAPLDARAELADALDLFGYTGEAEHLLATCLSDIDHAQAASPAARLLVARAVAHHLDRAHGEPFARAAADVVASAAQQLLDAVRPRRGRRTAPAETGGLDVGDDLEAFARALASAGEARAAQDVRAVLARLDLAVGADHGMANPVGSDGTDDLDAKLSQGSGTVSWPPRASWLAAANVANQLGATLVRARPGAVVLAPAVPSSWLGQNFEVHGLRTRAGVVSYAVRWHGARPALLWEVSGASGTTEVTAPGLDPAWLSGEPSGEALLAEVKLPAPAESGAGRGGVVIGGLQIGRRPSSTGGT